MELSIELKRDGISRTAVKVLAQFAKNDIDPFIAEQVNDGWTVESWIIKDSLPIDDGFLAAKAGKSADANPPALAG